MYILNIITMLLLLSILVLVHELGHFGVARMLGITVEKFGFGLPFGPTIYETKWGNTKICVHAFLLGGYVSFPDDDPDSEIPKDDPGRISNRPVSQRAMVVVAGVTANILTAFLLVLLVAGFSHNLPAGKFNVFVGGVQPDKTLSASSMNLQSGDRIVSANGTAIDSPFKFIEIAQRSKKFDGYASYNIINKQISSLTEKNPSLKGKDVDKKLPNGTTIILPSSVIEPALTANDDLKNKYTPDGEKLNPNQSNLRNQLQNKRTFTTDGSQSISDIAVSMSDTVHPVNITIERNGKLIKLPSAYPNDKGIVGIKLKSEEVSIPTTSVISSIHESWNYLYRNTSFMILGLVKLFTGQVPLQDLHGIVAITKVGGDIIQKKGMWDGILLTALISMDLAIVNLLPIPALDGGHLVFLLVEKIIGRPVDEKFQERISQYGFMFLIGLMVLIIFNDIFALLTDKL